MNDLALYTEVRQIYLQEVLSESEDSATIPQIPPPVISCHDCLNWREWGVPPFAQGWFIADDDAKGLELPNPCIILFTEATPEILAHELTHYCQWCAGQLLGDPVGYGLDGYIEYASSDAEIEAQWMASLFEDDRKTL